MRRNGTEARLCFRFASGLYSVDFFLQQDFFFCFPSSHGVFTRRCAAARGADTLDQYRTWRSARVANTYINTGHGIAAP
eukprot:2855998-Rhodomonas_salina.1